VVVVVENGDSSVSVTREEEEEAMSGSVVLGTIAFAVSEEKIMKDKRAFMCSFGYNPRGLPAANLKCTPLTAFEHSRASHSGFDAYIYIRRCRMESSRGEMFL